MFKKRIESLRAEMEQIFGSEFTTELAEDDRSLVEADDEHRAKRREQAKKRKKAGKDAERAKTSKANSAHFGKIVKGLQKKGSEKTDGETDADKLKKEKAAPAKKSSGGSGGAKKSSGGSDGSSGGAKKHNPWRNHPSRGPGPKGKPTDRKTKKWDCSCPGGTYAPGGCKCKNRQTGKIKKIKIDQKYHQDYNTIHHAWTARKAAK